MPMTAAACAQLEQVSRFFGPFAALRRVSAEFKQGNCYMVRGENGAGKSSLLRILAGLLRPSFGSVRIFGNPEPLQVRARIGYMGHDSMLYEELTAEENLRYFASLYPGLVCIPPRDALRQVGLDPASTQPVREYSQGMRQRVSFARVLVPHPELLLLDEPFANLDAPSASRIIALLAGLRQQRRTIILTTHQYDWVAPLADSVLTLQAGRIASFITKENGEQTQ